LDSTLVAASAAKKNRLTCLSTLVQHIESEDLYLIPSFLPEVILSTKEVNEKSRNAAFDLLIEVAKRMDKGGKFSMGVLEGPSDPQLTKKTKQNMREASIEELIKMIVAGLAGTSPHMMAATIGCLARLFYDYHESINGETMDKMIQSCLLLLQSRAKEVVKSVIGFFKVLIVILPIDDLGSYIPDIIEGLLLWSGEHTNHFKLRVKHILERIMKKIGYDLFYELVPEKHKKLATNLKKQREKARKKKGEGNDGNEREKDENSEEEIDKERAKGKEKQKNLKKKSFHEVMNQSDSEISDEEDYLPSQIKEQLGKKLLSKKGKGGTWIKENIDEDDDDNEPVDFLDKGALSRIVATKPSDKKKKLKTEDNFSYSEEGKLIIEDEDDEDENKSKKKKGNNKKENPNEMDLDDLFDEYENKKSRKRKMQEIIENEDENSNDEEEEQQQPQHQHKVDNNNNHQRKFVQGKRKEQHKPKLAGDEYKAKRARGDVKKAGKLDPFAYLPLTPTALNRRKKIKYQSEMHNILNAAKKGSEKGRKNRSKKRNEQ